MTYTVYIDHLNQEQWEGKARNFADYNLYQTWAYQSARIANNSQTLSHLEIVNTDGEICLMAMVRIMKIPLLGIRIGYIQRGPLLRKNSASTPISKEVLTFLREHLLSNGIDLLRMNPNVYTHEAPEDYQDILSASGFEFIDRISPYHTMLFPLDIPEDEMKKRIHKKWRASLRKAEKQGISVYETEDIQLLVSMNEMYQKVQKRKGFRGVNIDEFLGTQECLLPWQKMNIIVVENKNVPLTIDVNSYLGDTAIGLFQTTNESGLSLGSSYLAWWNTFLAAKRAEMKRYDLGGVDPQKNPSVYQYKLRLGADEVHQIGTFDAYANRGVRRWSRLLDALYLWIKKR